MIDYTVDFRQLGLAQQKAVLEFEKFNGTGIGGQYGELKDKLGRVPTQAEFIDECLPVVMGNWALYKDKVFAIGYTEDMDRAVKNQMLYRLDRNYRSFLFEDEAVKKLEEKFPGCRIVRNFWLDMLMGVDIVMVWEENIYCFHITKEGKDIKDKEKKAWYKAGDKWISYKRDFSRHIVWTYKDCLAEVPELIVEGNINKPNSIWNFKHKIVNNGLVWS